MLVLGLDPGTAITGYGLIRYENGRLEVVASGTLETSKRESEIARLNSLFNAAESLLAEHRPDAVAVEHLFFGRNVNTMLNVSRASGVLLLAAARASIPVTEYTPMQVKMAVVGYGVAEKQQVQFMVTRILGLDAPPKPDDVADALALAICHAHSSRLGALDPGGIGHRKRGT